ncbi:hypothetical protein BH11ARM2_BH11ARM2_29260 [soil metagenome]
MRPPFTVSSGLVLFLAILAVFSVNQRRNIPPRSTNQLAKSSDPFLFQARYSPIDWQTYSDAPFLQARRSGRPILLFIGSPYSDICREIDKAFEDENLAAYVTRNFIPTRIDGRIHPEWATAILPLQQLRVGALPEAQLWVLDPEGRVLHGILQSEEGLVHDSDGILQILIDSLREYENNREHPTDPQSAERAELLAGSGGSVPDFASYVGPLSDAIQSGDGRLPMTNQQEPLPELVRFFTVSGRFQDLDRFLDRVLYSSLSDGLDGGFYRLARGSRLEKHPFDKSTAQNADMAAALANAANLTGRQDWLKLAESTFDWVADDCVMEGGVALGRVDDSEANGRSGHSSFPSYQVRNLFEGEELHYAQKGLALDVSVNPLMAPYPVEQGSVISGLLPDVRSKLQKASSKPASMVSVRVLNVEGNVAARMLEAARALGDDARTKKAVAIAEGLSDFTNGSRLIAKLGADASDESSLHGYLAYADGCLQDYLATGNVPAFENGLTALQGAMRRFGTPYSGAYLAFIKDPAMKLGVVGADVPEITDAWTESLSAHVLRLQHAYGRLLRPSADGVALEKGAQETMARFSQVALGGRARTAGFFNASGAMVDDDFALAVGSRAVSEAGALQQRCPNRLVAPAYGPVRPDLQARAPGLYIVRGSQISGPFTVSDAADRLSPTLRLGIEQSR